MLKQEHRAQILEDLRQELLIKKERIDKSEDRDTGWFLDTPKILSAYQGASMV